MKYVEFIAKVTEIAEAAGQPEVVEFAAKELAKYEKAQETRKVYQEKKTAAKRAEKDGVRAQVLAVITAEPKTATTLVAEAAIEGLTRQAIPPLLKPLVEAGTVVKEQIVVEGAKGKQTGYRLA